MLKTMVLTGAVMLVAVSATAQTPPQSMPGMDMSSMKNMKGMKPGMTMKNTTANPYADAEMAMGNKMMMAEGSNASITYARKMIEHHQGAIDMSRIVLAHTQDAELKRVAQSMIDEQVKSQAELRAWLASHGG